MQTAFKELTGAEVETLKDRNLILIDETIGRS